MKTRPTMAFPSNSAAAFRRSFLASLLSTVCRIFSLSPSLPPFLPRFSSYSDMCNSRRERGLSTPQVSCEERNEEEENDEKPHGGSRDRRAKEKSERERAGEGRRRSGIHFEIASHPVRSPFFAASSSRHPPVAFSRLLPSGKATPPARFSPSFSLTLSFYLTLSGSLPFGRQRARLEY